MSSEINLLLGIGLLIYAAYHAILRYLVPHKAKRLQAMRAELGDSRGGGIHLFGYILMPLVAGFLILLPFFRG
ncbi:MAG: hypothetical protein AAF353_08790 [Pseudomonadota bacterium]